MTLRPTRAEVPAHQTWRLEDIFPTPEAWEEARVRATAGYDAIQRFRGTAARGAGALLAYLRAAEELIVLTNQIAWYADFLLSVDGANAESQAIAAKARPLKASAVGLEMALGTELVALPEAALNDYFAAEPALAAYKTFVQDLTDARAYMLSPEAETALAALNEDVQRPEEIFKTATTADMKFPPALDGVGEAHSVSLGEFLNDTELRPDTVLRRNAWASLTSTLSGFQNTIAANLNGHIGRMVRVAKLRGYPSVFNYLLESRLHGMYGGRQSVSVEAFHNVLDVIGTEVAPHMRRYARLRKRVLGLDKLHLCDVQAQLPAGPEFSLTWEQAQEMIVAATRVMGPDYGRIIRRAFSERWIDWAVNQGKPGVAYSYLVPGVHPYIFSSFGGGLRSLFVLAHELGHAVHEALSDECQNYLNNRWVWFYGEAPSTLNEVLLGRDLLRQTTDLNFRRRVLMTMLATYHHNLVTHLLEAKILRRFYELLEAGQPLTALVAGNETLAILRGFWGEEVEVDDAARVNWMRQPHYYMGLQPYTYAVGLSGATAVANLVEKEGAQAAGRWVETLKLGSSLPADEWFRRAGVEMTSPEPFRQACAYVGTLVDELERAYQA